MASKSISERRKNLLQLLLTKDKIKVGELANTFGVSTETIRKDLIYLEQEGLAQKQHGKAMIATNFSERPYSQKERENTEEKMQIARAAVKLIPPKGTIIMDSGSTACEIAKLLAIREDLTIFTNSLSVMQILSISRNRVFMFGGEIRKSSMDLIGTWTMNALKSIEADVAFLGTDGFSSREGPTSAAYEEVDIKYTMVKNSKLSAVVCDSSKFGRSDLFVYCGWGDVDYMITDHKAPEEEVSRICRHTSVILAEPL